MKPFILLLIPVFFLSQEIISIPTPKIKGDSTEFKNLDTINNLRILIIDASSNFDTKQGVGLYSKNRVNTPKECNKTKKKESANNSANKNNPKDFKRAKSLPYRGNLSVFLTNADAVLLENLSLKFANKTYSYNTDLADLYKQTIKKLEDNTGGSNSPGFAPSEGDKDTSHMNNLRTLYLDSALEQLKSTHMSLKSYQSLIVYKKQLTDSIVAMKDKISVKVFEKYLDVMKLEPTYVVLNPIPWLIEDVDEVDIELEYITSANTKTTKVASYRVNGGIRIRMNTNVFLSGLVNTSDIYFETNGSNEKFVRLEDDNKFSFGLGANAEMAFRIGRPYAPTLNFGFMLPLGEEDLTPFFTLGPGFSFGTGKVKASFSGGWAVGKVNRIKNRYKNIDLNTLEEQPTNYLSSVWKNSWQVSIGLSFNLLKNEGDK